jgi:MFS family permease
MALRTLGHAVTQRSFLTGALLIALAGLLLGLISVLAPLRLARLHWSTSAIGSLFLLTAAVETLLSPLLGRWSDRHGRVAPLRLGLALSAVGSVALAWSSGRWAFAGIVVGAGVAYGLLWTPATALLSDASAERGLGFVLGFALMNLAWSPGQLVGSAFGAAIAQATSDSVPYAIACGLCLVGFAALRVPPRQLVLDT